VAGSFFRCYDLRQIWRKVSRTCNPFAAAIWSAEQQSL
jgi:hypothetical protein